MDGYFHKIYVWEITSHFNVMKSKMVDEEIPIFVQAISYNFLLEEHL